MLREELLDIVTLNRWVNDDLVTLLPVDWSSDSVLVTDLQRVDYTQNLLEVTSSGSWVLDLQSDDLLWVNDKDGSHCEWNSLCVDVGWVQGVQHVIFRGDFSVLVTDDWEGYLVLGNFQDVLDPFVVRGNVVCRET